MNPAGAESELLDAVAQRVSGASRPVTVGIAGAVAVGKSTLARHLAARMVERGHPAAVIGTDAFLYPNHDLAAAGSLMRKGFPDTYDLQGLAAAIGRLRTGKPVALPVYSPVTYDRVDGAVEHVDPASIVIVEGVVALQDDVVAHLDIGVYLHAEERDLIAWYCRRFVDLCAAADAGEESFYRMFAGLTEAERMAVARQTWEAINGINLAEHIAPTRANADLVVSKAADHRMSSVRRQRRATVRA